MRLICLDIVEALSAERGRPTGAKYDAHRIGFDGLKPEALLVRLLEL
jgi:hypothetical protein